MKPSAVFTSEDRFGGYQEARDHVYRHGGEIHTLRQLDPSDYRYTRYEVWGCDGVGRDLLPPLPEIRGNVNGTQDQFGSSRPRPSMAELRARWGGTAQMGAALGTVA